MLPLALSIGILAGIWTFASGSLQLLTWPAFVGWALFYAAGGDGESVKKSLVPGILGMVLGLVVVKAAAFVPGAWFVPVGVTIIAMIMVLVMPIKIFSFAPAAFAGCAVYFGTNGDIVAAVIPFTLGIILGWLSAVLPKLFTRPETE